jgi:hypothetical protein
MHEDEYYLQEFSGWAYMPMFQKSAGTALSETQATGRAAVHDRTCRAILPMWTTAQKPKRNGLTDDTSGSGGVTLAYGHTGKSSEKLRISSAP